MNTNPNAELLDRQFLEPVAQVNGIQLQPFSPGILTCARRLGLKFITGSSEERDAQTEEEKQFDLMAMLWMLANDRKTVLQKVANREEFVAAVAEFEFSLPLSAIPEAAAAFAKIAAEANLAAVETIEKPKANSDGPQPPPNS